MPPLEEKISRRRFLKYIVAGGVAVAVGATAIRYLTMPPPAPPAKPLPDTVIIAWNAEITSMDPHKYHRPIYVETPWDALYDRYLSQDRKLNYRPGVIEKWEFVDPERKVLDLWVRRGIKFHDGTPLTVDDVIFSLQRAAQPGMAYRGPFGTFERFEKKGEYYVRAYLSRYDPSIIAWLGFLASFVLPKEPLTKLGDEKFFKNPIGSGPYKFVEWVPGSHLKLKSFEDYWVGPPSIKYVVFKETLDPVVRSAELEAGTADYTTEVPLKDFERLAALPALKGLRNPVTDVVILFVLPYYKEFEDKGVRLALHYAIDKKKLVNEVLLGFGIPVSTTEAPGYWAYPAGYEFPYDPEKAKTLLSKAGYSLEKPLRIKVQTTHGWIAKDREVVEAIADMWKKVGIEAEIEIYTLPMYFDYRTTGRLAHLAFYMWSNATGDPINSIYYSMAPQSPFSYWVGLMAAKKTDYTGLMDGLKDVMSPIMTEKDHEKRMEAARKAAIYVVEQGLIIPLYQRVQPIIMKKNLEYEPWPQGWSRVKDMKWVP